MCNLEEGGGQRNMWILQPIFTLLFILGIIRNRRAAGVWTWHKTHLTLFVYLISGVLQRHTYNCVNTEIPDVLHWYTNIFWVLREGKFSYWLVSGSNSNHLRLNNGLCWPNLITYGCEEMVVANLKNLTPGDDGILLSEGQSGRWDNLISIRWIIFAYMEETER